MPVGCNMSRVALFACAQPRAISGRTVDKAFAAGRARQVRKVGHGIAALQTVYRNNVIRATTKDKITESRNIRQRHFHTRLLHAIAARTHTTRVSTKMKVTRDTSLLDIELRRYISLERTHDRRSRYRRSSNRCKRGRNRGRRFKRSSRSRQSRGRRSKHKRRSDRSSRSGWRGRSSRSSRRGRTRGRTR